LHAPTLMAKERWVVTDRASGLEELLEGYREQHGTAGHLLCAFHILGNLVSHHGNMGENNAAFWEYVSAGNQKQLNESRAELAKSFPDHAQYLSKIDAAKLVAFEIAQRGGSNDLIRTSNMAEQENSRQKTLRIRSHCAPRGILEAFSVAHRVVGDVHELLTKEHDKGNVLVPWMNKIYQNSICDVGKARVERINDSTGIVTFQSDEGDTLQETKTRVDIANKQCSQCCLTLLCGIPCRHMYAFAVHTGKLKPAQSRAFLEEYAASRHHVDFVLNGLTGLNTSSLFIPVLSDIPLSLTEDLYEPPELEVCLHLLANDVANARHVRWKSVRKQKSDSQDARSSKRNASLAKAKTNLSSEAQRPKEADLRSSAMKRVAQKVVERLTEIHQRRQALIFPLKASGLSSLTPGEQPKA